MTDRVAQYAQDVLDDTLVTGPYVKAACQRHLDDLKREDLIWDYEAASRFFRFCEGILKLNSGQFEGKPFLLHPSQAFILGSLFGWKRPDGQRRFRRAYIEQGKGNGKSPLAGAIGLYGLIADGEAGAEVYAAGATKEQAGILFRDAVAMVRQSEYLDDELHLSGGPGREFNIAHVPSGSFFRPVSRETRKTGSGPRPHFALCDEIHEHPDGGVIEILERGFKFRENPLLLMITNSGSDRQSICWQERRHAINTAEQTVQDDTTFAYVCALDKDDDPFEDPDCWIKVNPLLGLTITRDYLQMQVDQAKAIPAKANGIRRLHFCEWTDSEEAWISRKTWEDCIDPTLELEDFKGKRCWMGLDLSQTRDLTAKALVFDDGFDELGRPRIACFVHAYTPEETLKSRADEDGMPYDIWVRDGYISTTPGSKIRLDYVAQDVIADSNQYAIDFCAYDKWLITDFHYTLDELGAEIPLVEHPQGYQKRKSETPDGAEVELWMHQSIEYLELALYEGRVRIHDNPCLTTAAMGAVFNLSPSGDLRFFAKGKADVRIDPLVALCMAAGAAFTRFGDPVPVSPWEDEDYSIMKTL